MVRGSDHPVCDGLLHKAAKLREVFKCYTPHLHVDSIVQLPTITYNGILANGEVFLRQGFGTLAAVDEESEYHHADKSEGCQDEGRGLDVSRLPTPACALARAARELVPADSTDRPALLSGKLTRVQMS